MREHLSEDKIKLYLSGEMEPAGLLDADDHLAGCDSCLSRVKDARRFSPFPEIDLTPLPAADSEHLGYERLEAIVDRKSGAAERETADNHLETCSQCRTHLNAFE
jgi:anti-sigma factor RsiW